MFEMAMELHELQRRAAALRDAISGLSGQMPEISKAIAARLDLPGDVKVSFEAIDKQRLELSTRLSPPAGGRFGGGGGRGGGAETPMGRLTQAKNGLMASMPATAQAMDAYARAKAEVPKTIAEAEAFLTKAQTLSALLARHQITLTVPAVAARPTPQ
jgi:hypothetical protein